MDQDIDALAGRAEVGAADPVVEHVGELSLDRGQIGEEEQAAILVVVAGWAYGIPRRSIRFDATLEVDARGVVRLRMPFDPTQIWGKARRHFVRGTINATAFEGSLGSRGGAWYFPVNKALQ